VLDSPANNAMAHELMLLLDFVAAAGIDPTPRWVEAELYRVAPIESADTVRFRCGFTGGLTAEGLLTHAGCETRLPRLEIEFEHGRLICETVAGFCRLQGNVSEEFRQRGDDWRLAPFENLIDAVLHDRPTFCDPAQVAPHRLLINGLFESAGMIRQIPESEIRTYEGPRLWPPNSRGHFRCAPVVSDWLTQRDTGGRLPFPASEPWAVSPQRWNLQNYVHFPSASGRFARWYAQSRMRG